MIKVFTAVKYNAEHSCKAYLPAFQPTGETKEAWHAEYGPKVVMLIETLGDPFSSSNTAWLPC